MSHYEELTGQKRYRVKKPIFGKQLLILQVQVKKHVKESDPYYGICNEYIVTEWRDATIEDMSIWSEE